MRKFLLQSVVVAMLIGVFASVSFAQSGRERVRFARGATSVVLKRSLSAEVGRGNITFIVNASKGQIMTFSVDGAEGC